MARKRNIDNSFYIENTQREKNHLIFHVNYTVGTFAKIMVMKLYRLNHCTRSKNKKKNIVVCNRNRDLSYYLWL